MPIFKKMQKNGYLRKRITIYYDDVVSNYSDAGDSKLRNIFKYARIVLIICTVCY